MKQETINILRKDLNKDKRFEEKFEKNKNFIYEIELLPVLTKRDKWGNIQEITSYSNSLLLRSENED